MDKKTLSTKTVKELKQLGATLGTTIPTGTLKAQLVQLIMKAQKKQSTKTKVKESTQKSSPKTAPTKEKTSGAKGTPTKEKTSDTKGTPTKEKTSGTKGTPTKEKTSGTKGNGNIALPNYINPKIKYNVIKQLGSRGKEGTTFLVKNKKGDEFAMKTFAKSKSSNTLQKEAYYQAQAAKFGIAPKIKEINEDEKYIIMDKLDRNLFDIVKKHNGEIPTHVQRKIIRVISKMDETGVFHGDPNPANFMIKGQSMYMIDYGFARDIDQKLIRKYQTTAPNKKFMILGLILKLKEIYRNHNPNIEYTVLSQMLSD